MEKLLGKFEVFKLQNKETPIKAMTRNDTEVGLKGPKKITFW